MNTLLAICARLADNDLIAAECENLTGGRPDSEGIAICQRLDLIPRAAYVTTGLRCLAEGETLGELTNTIARTNTPAEGFRVEFLRLSPRLPVRKPEAILAVANALDANPNLDAPAHRFLVVAREKGFLFGEILAENAHSYQRHADKPYRTSSSMPSRLARALVNLVSPPAQTILDPFCGTGSILLEACAFGLPARGVDSNPKMAGMTRRNLAHFGYSAIVEQGDMIEHHGAADAIVTDLPYGRFLEKMDKASLLPLLAHAAELAPQAVYLTEQDISPWLREAGYRDVQLIHVRKRAGMSRYVHRARV